MIVLTLAEAFERARAEAPGISEEDFLDQTRVLSQRSQIKVSAVRAVIRHDSETYEPTPEHCAASELDAREQIPADAWVNLALWFSNGGSASGWGHEHALPGRREFPEDCFEGLEVYISVVLIAESFNGLWSSGAGADDSPSWTDDELRSWLRDKERDLGHRPPVRTWKENDELMTGHGVTKQRFETVWRALYPAPEKGRRREEMPQERPKEKITSPRAS